MGRIDIGAAAALSNLLRNKTTSTAYFIRPPVLLYFAEKIIGWADNNYTELIHIFIRLNTRIIIFISMPNSPSLLVAKRPLQIILSACLSVRPPNVRPPVRYKR